MPELGRTSHTGITCTVDGSVRGLLIVLRLPSVRATHAERPGVYSTVVHMSLHRAGVGTLNLVLELCRVMLELELLPLSASSVGARDSSMSDVLDAWLLAAETLTLPAIAFCSQPQVRTISRYANRCPLSLLMQMLPHYKSWCSRDWNSPGRVAVRSMTGPGVAITSKY